MKELELEEFDARGEDVLKGVLWEPKTENWFPILDGLPVFPSKALQIDLRDFAAAHDLPLTEELPQDDRGQSITSKTFSDKWQRFKNYGMEKQHQEFLLDWYRKKFGLPTLEALDGFYASKSRILEVGPGSGFHTRLMAEKSGAEVVAVDISEGARTSYENSRGLDTVTVVQADLFEAPVPDDYFDFIVADGVLHHTPDTFGGVKALYRKLAPGGQFFFYVYRKMGPVRQFVDETLRETFTKMGPEECYEACEEITEIGRQLSKLDAKIVLEKGVPALGLPEGEHNLQRFFYYGFMKCFWNDAFDFETNNMVNFDWYHPHHAWQHTDDEVVGWLTKLGVDSYKMNDANPNGISVLLTKPA